MIDGAKQVQIALVEELNEYITAVRAHAAVWELVGELADLQELRRRVLEAADDAAVMCLNEEWEQVSVSRWHAPKMPAYTRLALGKRLYLWRNA